MSSSSSSSSQSLARLLAAEVDGRTAAPRYRLSQLRHLHTALLSNAQELREAIIADSGHTPAEAEAEFLLTMACVREFFGGIDVKKDVEEEYRVARGESAPERRVGKGLVWIVTGPGPGLFGVVGAVGAAVAAGNCVVVELPSTTQSLPALLRRILPSALDNDTFLITTTSSAPSPLPSCILVHQPATPPTSQQAIQYVTPSPLPPVLAIVDRTANLSIAAKALVTARFGFNGKSSYAPDVVLVDEGVRGGFVDAVVREAGRLLAEKRGGGGKASRTRRDEEEGKTLEEARRSGRVVVEGGNGIVIEIDERDSAILHRKINSPLLLIHTITSLDDAITFATTTTTTTTSPNPTASPPHLATMIFAQNASAKYLAQFIPSRLSLVNHIPFHLLVGPPYPLNTPLPLNTLTRYTPPMFTIALPILLPPPSSSPNPTTPTSDLITDLLTTSSSSPISPSHLLAKAQTLAATPLPEDDQRDGKRVGFFEQGLFIGTGVTALTVGGVAGVGVWGVRRFLRG
ncbi:MAG: hypothetical protein M1834_003703 [Cirrosporium novae-zelandiae]|nr:MAG: hypothetical protein M1834_003703 [Cirrosporium novae-zelandiae]